MGQAFDRDGNVMGEAYGATKREVFDSLNLRFKDAHEIRIQTTRGGSSTSVEMPRYRCHKEVWALKIADIVDPSDPATSGAQIVPADAGYAPFDVSSDFVVKHEPKIGGYYVVYKDGYKSFSPADAFESGYTRV